MSPKEKNNLQVGRKLPTKMLSVAHINTAPGTLGQYTNIGNGNDSNNSTQHDGT